MRGTALLMTNSFVERLERIQFQIKDAALRAGRDPNSVVLIGVSKKHSIESCKRAIESGLTHLGENYVQEWRQKDEALSPYSKRFEWHFIGGLQSNKVKALIASRVLIHTVDRKSLVKALNKEAGRLGYIQPLLTQVNEAEEPQKGGVLPNEFNNLVSCIAEAEHLELQGLMCIPPFRDTDKNLKERFKALRLRLDSLHAGTRNFPKAKQLSMGMSKDFVLAIEEGATMIRVGTALFGQRPP